MCMCVDDFPRVADGESNLQPVDLKSSAIATTPPSHRFTHRSSRRDPLGDCSGQKSIGRTPLLLPNQQRQSADGATSNM